MGKVEDQNDWKGAEFSYVEESKIPRALICEKCGKPFINPAVHLYNCGATFCATCVSPNQECRGCGSKVRSQDVVGLARPRDTLILNQLDALNVFCSSRAQGCKWQGTRKLLTDHLAKSCDHLRCPQSESGCTVLGSQIVLQKHEAECPWFPVSCKYLSEGCQVQAPRNSITTHEGRCEAHQQILDKQAQELLEQQQRLARQEHEEKQLLKETKLKKRAEERQQRARKDQGLTPIRLNVGGTIFETSVDSLLKVRSSYLHEVVSLFVAQGSGAAKKELFFDRDPKAFELMLNWLRTGSLPKSLTDHQTDILKMEAEHFELRELQALCGGSIDEDDLEVPEAHQFRYSPRLRADQLSALPRPLKLQGAELRGQWLAGFDFTEADLRGSDLRGANLSSANFFHADLRGCDLGGANLSFANFSDARLVEANLNWANLSEAVLNKADLTKVKLVGTRCAGFKLKGAILADVNLTQLIPGDSFQGAILTSAILPQNKQLDFTGSTLVDIDLRQFDITGWTLSDADIRKTTFHPPYLARAKSIKGLLLDRVDMSNWSIAGLDFRGVKLLGARLPKDLSRVNLSGLDLRQHNLEKSNLFSAQLEGTLLPTMLAGTDLRQSRLPNSLTSLDMSGCNLENMDLSNHNISTTNLNNANLKGAKLPVQLDSARLAGANLEAVDLSKCSVTKNADFSNANLKGAKLPVQLDSVRFVGTNLEGRDFSGCSVKGADFNNANLKGAKLPFQLDSIQFVGTNLEAVDLSRCSVAGANFSKANLKGAKLPVQLESVQFVGTNLEAVDLSGCSVRYANFSKANMRGVNFTDAKELISANFQYACLAQSYPIQSLLANQDRDAFTGCDFSQLDLTSCSFEKRNLDYTKFHGCTLSGVTMGSSSLIGADFTTANLSNANLSTCQANKRTIFTDCTLPSALPRCQCGSRFSPSKVSHPSQEVSRAATCSNLSCPKPATNQKWSRY